MGLQTQNGFIFSIHCPFHFSLLNLPFSTLSRYPWRLHISPVPGVLQSFSLNLDVNPCLLYLYKDLSWDSKSRRVGGSAATRPTHSCQSCQLTTHSADSVDTSADSVDMSTHLSE